MIVKIYYDKFKDELTFVNRNKGLSEPIAKISVPDDTEKDGDCYILQDSPTACFPRRRVSATELFIRASFGSDEVYVTERTFGGHLFLFYGKHKEGVCLHGYKFPCPECVPLRHSDEKYGTFRTDEEFKDRYTRKKQEPV